MANQLINYRVHNILTQCTEDSCHAVEIHGVDEEHGDVEERVHCEAHRHKETDYSKHGQDVDQKEGGIHCIRLMHETEKTIFNKVLHW